PRRPAADAGAAPAGAGLALPRGPAHGRGHAPADPAGHRHVRPRAAEPEWRAAAPGGAVEVRLQEHQVDRPHGLHRSDASHRLEPGPAQRIRLLLHRQPGRAASALEPAQRAPHCRRGRQPVRPPHSHPALQRLRRTRGRPLRGDGPAQVVLVAPGRIDWRWVWWKAGAHVLLLLPLASLVRRTLAGGLGPDPVAELTHGTGDWALRLLLLCLAMTP